MCAYKVGALLALALVSCAVHCRDLRDRDRWQHVAARCAALSVTAVSCAQHTPDALLPHPDDCELFYYCVSSSAAPVCRQCPAHLHFSPSLHVCDYPAVAGCALNSTTSVTTDSTDQTWIPTHSAVGNVSTSTPANA